MDQESLYTATKWDILKLLERQQLSPLEMSKLTGGSLANISQQLRLLEMAGLVTSERIPNRDKGQPRVLYSIADDSCYVISTANDFVEKRRLSISATNRIVLQIWFLQNPELRTYVEKAFWKVEEQLPKINALLLDTTSTNPINLYIVASEKLAIPEIQELRQGDETKQLIVTQIDAKTLHELRKEGEFFVLHDVDGEFKK